MKDDKNIEQFFRKHLDVEQPSFIEDDWAKMEAKLDAAGIATVAANQGIGWLKGGVILGVVSIITFLIGWFARPLFSEDNSRLEARQNVKIQNSKNSELTNSYLKGHLEFPDNTISNESSNQVLLPIRKKATINFAQKSKMVEEEVLDKKRSGPFSNQATLKTTSENVTKTDFEVINSRNDIKSSNINVLIDSVSRESEIIESDMVTNYEDPPKVEIESNENLSSDEKKSILLEEKEKAKIPAADNQSQIIQWGAWGVGVSFAPDFNSIGLNEKQTITGKIGARVFWEMRSKISIESGLYYSNKHYFAQGEHYTPPKGYWINRTNGVIPSQIEGTCRVIDIPVLVSFKLLERVKWGLNVTTGLSNYILLDQWYYYDFDQPNPGASENWSTEENIKQNWSIINCSFGIDYHLNTLTSIRLEPYLAVPLQELGWANVRIYSIGTVITIRRKLQILNKKE